MDKINSFWLESILLAKKYYPRLICLYCSPNHTLQFLTDTSIEASIGLMFQAISVLDKCSGFPFQPFYQINIMQTVHESSGLS